MSPPSGFLRILNASSYNNSIPSGLLKGIFIFRTLLVFNQQRKALALSLPFLRHLTNETLSHADNQFCTFMVKNFARIY